MATKTLVPTGTVSEFWLGTGQNHSLVDETTGSHDSATTEITSSTANQVDRYSFADGEFVDGDTITQIDVKIAAWRNGGTALTNIAIDIFIGGASQNRVQNPTNLSGSYVVYTLNDANWNQDFSASQMNGIEVELDSWQTGKAIPFTLHVTAIEIFVTYTEAAGGLSIPVAMASYRRRRT